MSGVGCACSDRAQTGPSRGEHTNMPAIRCKPAQAEAGVRWFVEEGWWVDLSGAIKQERGRRRHRDTWAFLKEGRFLSWR